MRHAVRIPCDMPCGTSYAWDASVVSMIYVSDAKKKTHTVSIGMGLLQGANNQITKENAWIFRQEIT